MKDILSRFFRPPPQGLSFARLASDAPQLAAAFAWRANRLPAALPDPLWLHLGCGENVIDGFLNLDFIPGDGRVAEWDFLDPWPESWPMPAKGAFSEDTLEHFFLAEQLYILCEVNRALSPGAVFRVLMPSYERLLAYCRGFAPRRGEFLHETFAVETEADAVNAGLRFSGHRWLHDDASLGRLAGLAGFEALKTSCAESTVPFLSGRNLRAEEGSAAFAHDLVKRNSIHRVVVEPSALRGLKTLEEAEDGVAFAEVGEPSARIVYELPRELDLAAIACLNARSANLSSFREHSLKRFLFATEAGEGAWSLDETLKSKACMNLATPVAANLACRGKGSRIRAISLEPGRAGDRVTVGPLEIYWREPGP